MIKLKFVICRDKDHSCDISDDAFSDLRNGAPLQLPPAPEDQEFTLDQLFGIVLIFALFLGCIV